MNYYLLIPFFLIVIFFLPIKLTARVSFNLLDFSGAFGIFIYRIKIDHQMFWIENKKIITKKDDEVESKELNFESKEVVFLETFMKQIKDKTRLRELQVFYNFGANDAFLTSMLAGYINTFLIIILNRVKNMKPTASLGIFDTISYNKEVCQFALKTILSISLFDVAYSLLTSVILSRKINKRREIEEEK